MGGADFKEGNVFAYNPATSKYGAVCDDTWTQSNVRRIIYIWPFQVPPPFSLLKLGEENRPLRGKNL